MKHDKQNDKFASFANDTNKEVRLWSWAAWTLPFVALSGIFFLDIIGLDSWIHTAIVIGGVVFFTIAVYWWWWAIHKVSKISTLMLNTAINIKEIGKEIKEFKKDFNKNDK